jgi:hypothetical protein
MKHNQPLRAHGPVHSPCKTLKFLVAETNHQSRTGQRTANRIKNEMTNRRVRLYDTLSTWKGLVKRASVPKGRVADCKA